MVEQVGEPIVENVQTPPHLALRGLVRSLVGYRYAGLAPAVHVGLPSPGLPLLIAIDAPMRVTLPGANAPEAFGASVGGLAAAPSQVHFDGQMVGVQLDLSPLGARTLLGVRCAELAGAQVDLAAVLPGAGELPERLAAQRDWVDRLTLVQQWLLAAAASRQHGGVPRAEVVHVWRRLVGSAGRAPVRALAAEVGWSPRHLTAQFTAELGLAPKLAARVIRFDRARRSVRPGASISEVAARAGYADHSHLVRDWHDFVGMSPSRWMREDGLAFVQDTGEAGAGSLST